MKDLGLPARHFEVRELPDAVRFPRNQKALAGTGIHVPALEDYAWKLWDYWERHLDPELSLDRSLRGAVRGKRVLITGGGAGIGKATGLKIAAAGADLMFFDRDEDGCDRYGMR